MRSLVVVAVLATVAHAQTPGSGSGKVIQLPTDSAAPEVSASASPSDIKLGARFTLFVTASFGDGVEVNLREPIALGSAFEVKRRVSEDHLRGDRHVREWQLDVYAWELGELAVPPVAVTFTVAGRVGQVETNAVPVRVTGVLGDVDDPKLMRDSAPPVPLLGRDWLWAWICGGAGALVGAVVLALWLRRRRRRRVVRLVGGNPDHAPRRIDLTSARALELLLAIERSGVLDVDASRKLGYTEIAAVIREYLGARYRVATLDLTSAELLRALAKVASELSSIAAWLERCDVVKYGGHRATAADARAVLADARAVVMATTAEPAKESA